jgi:hypothetical protein
MTACDEFTMTRRGRGMQFHPSAVDGCGKTADAIANTVSAVAKRFTSTAELINGDSVTTSAAALDCCQTSWRARISRQATDTSTTAAHFHEAARDYVEGDHRAAEGIIDAGRIRAALNG